MDQQDFDSLKEKLAAEILALDLTEDEFAEHIIESLRYSLDVSGSGLFVVGLEGDEEPIILPSDNAQRTELLLEQLVSGYAYADQSSLLFKFWAKLLEYGDIAEQYQITKIVYT